MVAEGYKIQSFAYACADFAVSDVAAGARLRRPGAGERGRGAVS